MADNNTSSIFWQETIVFISLLLSLLFPHFVSVCNETNCDKRISYYLSVVICLDTAKSSGNGV